MPVAMRQVALPASVFVGAITLLLAGCATLPHGVETPRVTVRSVAVESAGLTGLSGRLDLDVFNPNQFGLPLEGCTWQLAVAGDQAVSGRFDLSRTIPAQASAPVESQLSIDVLAAARVGAHLAAGQRRYRLTGTLRFATALGPLTVDFSHEGELGG